MVYANLVPYIIGFFLLMASQQKPLRQYADLADVCISQSQIDDLSSVSNKLGGVEWDPEP